jgi:hypothetical protein
VEQSFAVLLEVVGAGRAHPISIWSWNVPDPSPTGHEPGPPGKEAGFAALKNTLKLVSRRVGCCFEHSLCA